LSTFVWTAVVLLVLLLAAYYLRPQTVAPLLIALNRRSAGLVEKTVALAPHTVHYLEGGKGAPLVLLHGIFAEKDHWVDFARPLTGRYRVLAPDLPGYGKSGRFDDQAYDYAAQVERLGLWLDAVGVQQAHLAGSSMGGTIAALFALRYPQRVLSVALVGAPHGIRTPQDSAMDTMIAQGQSPLIVRTQAAFKPMLNFLFAKHPFLPYPVAQQAMQEALANANTNVRLWEAQLKDRYLLDSQIDQLNAPTLVLWGAQDKLFDASGADVLKQRLKHGHVQTLAGVGHLPMMEVPRAAAKAYAAFLQSVIRPHP
jgi:pimeloyl-ACP methyl ester carboxylesterase